MNNEIEDNCDPIYVLIREQLKDINTEKLTDEVDNSPVSKETQKQQVYIWIRLYVKEEVKDIKEGDDIVIIYLPSGEKLESKFICFGKKNSIRDADSNEIQMSQEDDTKCLILMVNEDTIQNSNDIPFIRSLFKISRHYQYQVYRREELTFTNQRTNVVVDYYDCDF